MAFSGINFRASAGFVADGTGETYSLGEAYPTTRGGLTFGWGTNRTGNSRDRNSSLDRREAGIVFVSNSGGTDTFRLDLPGGAGTYKIRLALGDANSAQDVKCVIKDGTTTKATINVSPNVTEYGDAVGAVYSAGGWVTANSTIDVEFAGSYMVLELGGHAVTDKSSVIAHVAVELVSAGDTTAPTLTSPTGTQTGPTTATVGATTDEGNGTLYAVVTASATAPSVAQIKAGQNESGAAAVWSGSVAVSSTGAKTLNATGLTASTSYYAHLVHADSAGNNSNVVSSAQFTTAAGADTTLPTLTGTITISSLTTTSYTASWPAGSDNVAVTGYEYRINAGTWTDNGNSLSVGISGRTPGSTDTFEVRAYDAAGNRSTPALSQSVTLNSTAVGTVTVGSALYPIRNASNTVLDESSIRVSVMRADTLEQVYHGPGHAITAGVLTVSDAAIVAGTAYHVSVKTAAGWIGMSDQVTAT